jgi:DNA modification methylase
LIRILRGDCRDVLKTLPDESVHCVVTSPPYFGLRDYGTATWEGGDDPACNHRQGRPGSGRADGVVDDRAQRNRDGVGSMGGDCGKCGARRVDSQIGLEPTPDEFVAAMVEVFREVRRVLRKDGTCWLNLGDSYATGGGKVGDRPGGGAQGDRWRDMAPMTPANRMPLPGLKPKDLIGIPWRVAFALQADGWYLRQDIIWAKPNPMPESVRDRCTKSHEYIFLLAKSERYFYDAEAIAEEGSGRTPGNVTYKYDGIPGHETKQGILAQSNVPQMVRNKRSVWTVATQPFKEAHFATFPPDLIEPCIKAGTSEKGCCSQCGAPWVRVTEPGEVTSVGGGSNMISPTERIGYMQARERLTKGWQPSCTCDERLTGIEKPSNEPCTVLDPFGGAGTTGLVADRLGRNALLIELNPEYADMATRRIQGDASLFAQVDLTDVTESIIQIAKIGAPSPDAPIAVSEAKNA